MNRSKLSLGSIAFLVILIFLNADVLAKKRHHRRQTEKSIQNQEMAKEAARVFTCDPSDSNSVAFKKNFEAGDYGMWGVRVEYRQCEEKNAPTVTKHFFLDSLTTKDVIDTLASLGLRPATLNELVAWGAKNKLDEGNTVVALGSFCPNEDLDIFSILCYYYPAGDTLDDKEGIKMIDVIGGISYKRIWGSNCFFLAAPLLADPDSCQ